MTLGERAYRAAVATGAHAFAHLAKDWDELSDDQRATWEKCGVMLDAATRADVVGQLDEYASGLDGDDGHDWAVRDAAAHVEAGR